MQSDLDPRPRDRRALVPETNWDAIAEWTDDKYMQFDVQPVGRAIAPASSMFSIDIGEITMTHFSYGTEVSLRDFDAEAGNVLVLTTLRGRTRHRVGHRTDAVLSTGQTFVADCSRADYRLGADDDHLQLNLTVPHRLLADLALRWWGHVPDDSLWSRGCEIGGAGTPWINLLGYATSTAAVAPDEVSSGRIGQHLQETIAAQLLRDWALRAEVDLERRSTVAAPGYVRAAVHYIEANARDLPTVAEIAGAAGISVRSLSGGFSRYLGTSVRSYLVEQRLQGVYRELLSGGTSVTASAHGWGYVNLGVFAASYRRRFGEKPSETLARARR
ncbi:AraC family transcriptional regulator [Gordonia sp. (in: high G+C Gram-positive bacteria)]|uniref:AraC family transcriptional regulator n=1 Tax=Gordonia sp. (in: high G+C Gram-positive bacteria) TaxID=84139 RepID=UPI00169BEC67|nr:AraC family transcriptional regulator [Gordonia sp. (in: high G+C Gram-positive bacteria)]NLG45091.1 AraC family transcriptional regulator [Gordonia sp. (in: high G+C Gram-positive bacteria)]